MTHTKHKSTMKSVPHSWSYSVTFITCSALCWNRNVFLWSRDNFPIAKVLNLAKHLNVTFKCKIHTWRCFIQLFICRWQRRHKFTSESHGKQKNQAIGEGDETFAKHQITLPTQDKIKIQIDDQITESVTILRWKSTFYTLLHNSIIILWRNYKQN